MKSENILRVLYVDDDEDDFLLARACFEEIPGLDYELTWCPSYKKALAYLKRKEHDLYLFDFYLGEFTGIELIKKAYLYQCEGPIILLTGRNDEAAASESLRTGATDYLVKSELNAQSLQRSIRYSLERTSFTKAIQQSERRYRKIFEESGDMLLTTDLRGHILHFNNSTLQLSGYSSWQLQEISLPSLIVSPEFKEVWASLAEQLEVSDVEVTLKTSSGDKRICIFSASLELDRDKTYVQCRLSDITSRRQSERERLFSEKMAVSGRLIKMLAHEVRNPLTNITLSAEQLESEFEGDDLTFYTQIIKRNCGRINELITQLLQSSRPGEVNLRPGDMREVMDDAISAADDRLRLKKIKVVKRYAAEIPSISVDRTSLQLAYLNLINNAIEAVEVGVGVLTVSLQLQGTELKVLIGDNGCGIGEEVMQQIFEPYFTGKKTGMGVGLATTLSIVHSHGGRIDVESELGAGTTFSLSFPLLKNNSLQGGSLILATD
jgi:PAS domain S-box-containing protein